MNVVTVIGNLTKDPELKSAQNGTSIARCGIAVRRDRKEANGEYASDFFDLVAWGSTADFICKNLRKGSKVCVSGSVHARQWQDRDGAMRISVEIHANNCENLTPREKQQPAEQPAQANHAESSPVEGGQNLEAIDVTDDDLPF